VVVVFFHLLSFFSLVRNDLTLYFYIYYFPYISIYCTPARLSMQYDIQARSRHLGCLRSSLGPHTETHGISATEATERLRTGHEIEQMAVPRPTVVIPPTWAGFLGIGFPPCDCRAGVYAALPVPDPVCCEIAPRFGQWTLGSVDFDWLHG
jgi:hypothetical protein